MTALICLSILTPLVAQTAVPPTTSAQQPPASPATQASSTTNGSLHFPQTMSELRAQTPATGLPARAWLGGYHAPGDGGGGQFVWVPDATDADDGGVWIAPSASAPGRWKRQYAGAVNVRWFGARGDGSPHDLEPFERAVSHFSDVYVPAGRYVICGTFDLPSNSDFAAPPNASALAIRGAGAGSSVIRRVSDEAGPVIRSLGPSHNVLIEDLTVRGGQSATGHGIEFELTYHSTIRRVEATDNGGAGILIRRGFYNTASDCWSHRNRDGVHIGSEANANLVLGGHYDENTRNGVRIAKENDIPHNPHGNSIIAATVESTLAGTLVEIDRSFANRITSCYVEGNAEGACGLAIREDGELTASHNVVRDTEFVGLDESLTIEGGRGNHVDGNTVRGSIDIGCDARQTFIGRQTLVGGTINDAGQASLVLHDPLRQWATPPYYSKGSETSGEGDLIRYAVRIQGESTQLSLGDAWVFSSRDAYPDPRIAANNTLFLNAPIGSIFLRDGEAFLKSGATDWRRLLWE